MTLDLLLRREPSRIGATIGSLFALNRWYCWTLEDVVREVEGQPVSAWKVPGQTAIPRGRYRVTLSRSQRFGRVLPELHEVPGFSGIRIHAGNTAADTEGCILVGMDRTVNTVTRSRAMESSLVALMQHGGWSEMWMTVE